MGTSSMAGAAHKRLRFGRLLSATLVAFGALSAAPLPAQAGRITRTIETAAAGAVAKTLARRAIQAEEKKLAGEAARLTAAARAKELHAMLPEGTRGRVTTAVTETSEGKRVVSSSEKRLRPALRRMLHADETEGIGVGHAEVTGVEAALARGLKATETAASRPICPSCRKFLQEHNITPGSPLKVTK